MPCFSVQQLRKLIGLEVKHQGICCRIVEVLEREPALVLESCGQREAIQDNQYGDPHRRRVRGQSNNYFRFGPGLPGLMRR
jgi:hypothetical protein